MSTVQAVLFDRQTWGAKRATAWLSGHGFRPIKAAHITDRYLRYRMIEPEVGARYRIINAGDTGIRLIVRVG